MKKISILLFLIGVLLILISINPSITGAVIGKDIDISNYISFTLGLSLMFVSSLMYLRAKSLEAIVIPTGGDALNEKRMRVAMKKYESEMGDTPYVLVPGLIDKDKRGRVLRETQQYKIYKELRNQYGLKPSDMIIEGKSTDTLDNYLYSLSKIKKKGINQLQIATSPTQFWRFKMFNREAKREGLVPESFEVKPLYTRESPYEFVYGVLAYVKDYIRLKSEGSLEEASKHKTGVIGKAVKKLLKVGG